MVTADATITPTS